MRPRVIANRVVKVGSGQKKFGKSSNLAHSSLSLKSLSNHAYAKVRVLQTAFTYEGWNFNFGNTAVTFDTAYLQSSYFHRPSMYSPKLCRTCSQR